MPVTPRLLPFLLSLLFSAGLAGQSSQQPKPTPTPKPKPPKLTSQVILISISGFRSDYLTNATSYGLRIPTLRELQAKFGDWPLALAAYNAGAGRVQRTLDRQKARTFAEIADALPLETRLYVPKVLAVLQVRAGVALAGSSRP